MARPTFQCQGPDGNCVIKRIDLSWASCTAYAMAMLLDASGVEPTPTGCRVRRLVRPRDRDGGLYLSQVADVAEQHFGVVIAVRTGWNAIPVAGALARLRNGRGFVLQGNNAAFSGLGVADHAIYVHAVRGGTDAAPDEALVYDPQRRRECWMPWRVVLRFGELLRVRPGGGPLGPGVLYAGIGPRRPTPEELSRLPAAVPEDGVDVRFGARRLPARDRTRAHPPPGRRVNVRSDPRRMDPEVVVETLGRGERFVAWQRLDEGARPDPGTSRTWYGNRDGTEWVHESGLRRIGGRA
jgi:hypothetical protein